jgi:hypothetical protein
MIGVAASSLLFLPTLRAINPSRRLMGLSVDRYTVVSVLIAVAISAAIAVTAFALT